jgi:malate dehydrogenase (oxaloacetate-decarboxylating)
MLEEGMTEADVRASLVLVDSRGLVHTGRADLDETKRDLALPDDDAGMAGLDTSADRRPPDLLETILAVRPSVLVGTTGVAGTFTEPVIRAIAAGSDRPIILPLSNPTSAAEAVPSDLLRWTDGRALVATGSPFPAVALGGRVHEIGQANNVFVFPGLGLGAIVAEARAVSDEMFLIAARTVADAVTAERFASGAIYPPVSELRSVSRSIAIAVATEAVAAGLVGVAAGADLTAAVDGAMWWPAYVPYVPSGEVVGGPTVDGA